jgi:galactokinase
MSPGFEKPREDFREVRSSAPGRVNLIGEHTDYSGGFVLPVAIPQRCVAVVTRRVDAGGSARVRASSANRPEEDAGEYTLGEEKPGRGWIDYVQGATRLSSAAGLPLHGFELAVSSEIPMGAGLSSSAALSVAVLRALRLAFDWPIDDVDLARLARKIETDFVGAPVGIMDPMAVSLAGEREALFLDTRSLFHQCVPIPEGCELGVIDSGVPHTNAGPGYRSRRAECDEAARRLGVPELRDLLGRNVDELAAGLPPPLGRRVRHVLTENARVLAFVDAMRAGDVETLGRILAASHRSLRDDFEVSIPEIDLLVHLAEEQPGVLGARLTGGGFGGSILLLARTGRARAAADETARNYAARTSREARVLLPLASDRDFSPGARRLHPEDEAAE